MLKISDGNDGSYPRPRASHPRTVNGITARSLSEANFVCGVGAHGHAMERKLTPRQVPRLVGSLESYLFISPNGRLWRAPRGALPTNAADRVAARRRPRDRSLKLRPRTHVPPCAIFRRRDGRNLPDGRNL